MLFFLSLHKTYLVPRDIFQYFPSSFVAIFPRVLSSFLTFCFICDFSFGKFFARRNICVSSVRLTRHSNRPAVFFRVSYIFCPFCRVGAKIFSFYFVFLT